MYVLVDLSEERLTLAEPSDFGRFHVEVTGGFDEGAVDLLLGNDGRLASVGEAFISIAALRVLAADAVDEPWEQGLVAMVDYAAGKGWLDDTGTSIRAHVEWPPDSVA
jgi:hypothetical protein